jgi:hypothetical protein
VVERLIVKSFAVALVAILALPVGARNAAHGATAQGQDWRKNVSVSAAAPQGALLPSLSPSAGPRKAPNPVVVSFLDGGLTVEAEDAALNDILRAISAYTGTVISVPALGNERMTRQIGPAPVEEIVDSLLSGQGLNYIIEGRGGPGVPLRVMFLSERPATAGPRLVEVQRADVPVRVEPSLEAREAGAAWRQTFVEQQRAARLDMVQRLAARW